MGLGAVLGQNYKLPANTARLQAQGQAQPQAPAIGNPATEALQNNEGQADEYYKNWGELESFANNLWENFRIDVTKPDFRKPEAMDAHKVYKKAIANLRIQRNNLTNSQKELEQYQKDFSQGNTAYKPEDPSQPFSALDVKYTGKAREELAQSSLDRTTLQQTSEDDRNKKRIDAANSRASTKLQIQNDKLSVFTRDTTDLAELLQGGGKWYSSNEIGPSGEVYLKNDLWSGKSYGRGADGKKRTIDGFLFDPSTGEQLITFKEGAPESINKDDFENLFTTYVNSNRGDRAKGEAQQYLTLLDEGGIDIFDSEVDLAGTLQTQVSGTKIINDQKVKALAKLDDMTGVSDPVAFTSPDGFVIKVNKVKNLRSARFTITDTDDSDLSEALEDKKFTADELIALLVQNRMFGTNKPSTINKPAAVSEPVKLNAEEQARMDAFKNKYPQ